MNLPTTRSFDFTFYNDNKGCDETVSLTFRYVRHWDEINFEDHHLVAQYNLDAMMRFLWVLLVNSDKEKLKNFNVDWGTSERVADYKILSLLFPDPPWSFIETLFILNAMDEVKAKDLIKKMRAGAYGEASEDSKKKIES